MKSSRLLVTAVLAAALPLAGCTPLDVFGPRPNGEIMALAKQAEADGELGNNTDAPWREMRLFHAGQLRDEARRLCGTDEQGEPPSTCDVDFDDSDLPAPSDSDKLIQRTVSAAEKVPDESVDLVVAQAIDVLALDQVDLDRIEGPLADATDAQTARDLLAREHATRFALDVAQAYAGLELRLRIDTLRNSSEERTEALRRLLASSDDSVDHAIVPAPGYEFANESDAPTSADEAARLVDKLEGDLITQWRFAAAHAESARWRDAAIRLAAHAQRG